MKSLNELEAMVNALAGRIGAPARAQPTFGRTQDGGHPHIEIDADSSSYHYVAVERGLERHRQTTTDVEELLYWIFADITHRLAFDFELHHRVEDRDSRRVAFPKQVELMTLLSPAFGQRIREAIERTLVQAPYDDGPTRALKRLRR